MAQLSPSSFQISDAFSRCLPPIDRICRYKKGTVPAATNATEATAAEEPSATQPAAANGTGWWPANEVTPPLTIGAAR